jgi:serine phosphatase RsbU (regulator of sigma subunit)
VAHGDGGSAVEQRLERLQRVASALSDLLNPHEVADIILRDAAPELGGARRALWLLDDAGRELALVHPESHERAAPFSSIPLDSDLPGAVVVRTGTPLFLTTKAERDQRFPVLVDVGPQVSMAVLPLVAAGGVLGVLACSYDEEHAFPDDERRYLVAVCELAAQALERSRLHNRQVEVARALQATLLPPELPAITGMELATAYHPAMAGTEVGGDFYDAFALPGGDRWAVVIGDVCGTGPDAAALTAQARHTLRAVLRTGLGIEAAMSIVNDTLAESLDAERFCTMVLASVTPTAAGASVDLVCAGHPTPLVLCGNGEIREAPAAGAMVGAFADQVYVATALELGSGDALVLFTDGVTEARHTGDPAGWFGTSGLEAALAASVGGTASTVVKAIEGAIFDFSGGRFTDDVAILVLRVVP